MFAPSVIWGVAVLLSIREIIPSKLSYLAWPWAPYLRPMGLKHGVRVTVSPWRKFQSRMMPTTAKACGQYLNSMLAGA